MHCVRESCQPVLSGYAHVEVPAPTQATEAFIDAVAGLIDEYRIDWLLPAFEEVFYLAAHRDRLGDARALLKPMTAIADPTTGGIINGRSGIVQAYRTGRGSVYVRAKAEVEVDEKTSRETIIVHEIPYQVNKARLIEKIAELLTAKKLPLLNDVRDESAEDVRVVLEPKNRTVDPTLMMEQMFRNTELEARIPLNMNVLSHGKVPKVMSLRQVLREWLDHRKDVLVRRSNFRLGEIARRLEILEGYLVAYLNLDEVIRIIREEDEPKSALMARFKLTDNQAEAILNMRLRALRKLEEMEIRGEHQKLTREQKALNELLKSDDDQWATISEEIKAVKEKFSKKTPLGRRRTDFSEAPEIDLELEQSMIEKEPVTVVCSEKGWIRTMKGHMEDVSGLTYKDGDKGEFTLHAMSTDKVMLFSSSGKFFTLDVGKLPGGRGHGEPVRLLVMTEKRWGIVGVADGDGRGGDAEHPGDLGDGGRRSRQGSEPLGPRQRRHGQDEPRPRDGSDLCRYSVRHAVRHSGRSVDSGGSDLAEAPGCGRRLQRERRQRHVYRWLRHLGHAEYRVGV